MELIGVLVAKQFIRNNDHKTYPHRRKTKRNPEDSEATGFLGVHETSTV